MILYPTTNKILHLWKSKAFADDKKVVPVSVFETLENIVRKGENVKY